ncbi:MAG: FAD-binding oxidoreductase [Actinobacteria bacterium]|nr:MAG: FAD-binding oxidoreductase [Actinomycetota bacterium]
MARTADAVIIGAGTTGLSIAFHMAGTGMRDVLVLERRFVGAGGTGRSVGIIRQLYPTRETTAMVVRSLAVYRDFDAAVGGQSGYVRCGALIGVDSRMRATLETTMKLQRSLGVRAELLDPSDVARVEPRIDASRLGAVLYEPESGYADPSGVRTAASPAWRRPAASASRRPSS